MRMGDLLVASSCVVLSLALQSINQSINQFLMSLACLVDTYMCRYVLVFNEHDFNHLIPNVNFC